MKYDIPEESDIGQRLLELSAISGSLIGEQVTKTYVVEQLNDLIRSAKGLRNKIKDWDGLKGLEVRE